MSDTTQQPTTAETVLRRVKTGLRLVCSSLPHLSGLAAAIRLYVDGRVPTAAISATGRLFVNPEWFSALQRADAVFVLAHELLHLCLQTHERGLGTDKDIFNWAHDYLINDILTEQLEQSVPADGLVFPGARHLSAEKIVTLMKNNRLPGPRRGPRSDMTRALEEAGLLPPIARQYGPGTNDIVDPDLEREWFPDADPVEEERRREQIRRLAAKAVSLGMLKDRAENLPTLPVQPQEGPSQEVMEALHQAYAPLWEVALQNWLEAVAPGPRSYARPSRRMAGSADVVLAGRRREGWTLHIVLDTSGSMAAEIPRVLGAVSLFCEGVGVAIVHILQCDVDVTKDEWVDPIDLGRYEIKGFGGSDMAPALLRLASDPEVEAAIVVTDGDISYPSAVMPYRVLWVLTMANEGFKPAYGHVLLLPAAGA